MCTCPAQIGLELPPKKKSPRARERERERERGGGKYGGRDNVGGERVCVGVWPCKRDWGPVGGQRDKKRVLLQLLTLLPYLVPWKKQEYNALQCFPHWIHWMGQQKESHQIDYRNCAEFLMVKDASNAYSV